MAPTPPAPPGPLPTSPIPAGAARRDPGRVLILGAGPTGLGAAYRLRELGHADWHVSERGDRVGGLARSYADGRGFTWDVGGHVLFSHYAYYDRVFEELMRGAYTLNARESWVRILGTWVPYPFQNNIRYLPPEARADCLAGLIRAQALGAGSAGGSGAAGAANFGEFIDRVFGEGIARLFMRPYNFKVWAHPPELMNKTWIGERVAVIDWERALRNVLLERDDFGWGPNNRFKYPLGGTGDFYDRFAPLLEGRLSLRRRAVRVDVDRREVTFAEPDGRATTERYDALLSTLPLDLLCRDVLAGDVPAWVRRQAGRLRHSGGVMVGVGVRRPCPSGRSWMYFPEDDCPFYRVTYLSNYSPRLTPDPDRHYSLLCETSFSAFKPVDPGTILEDTLRGLENVGLLAPGERGDIVSTWVFPVEHAYPTPGVERDGVLAEVIPWLESRGVYSRGRFGLWKYEVANTDHSLMQGVELIDRLVLGTPETTIGMTYRVTEDGRNAAEHERPAVAGSGEKRLGQPPSAPEVAPEPAPEVVVTTARGAPAR